MAHMLYAELNLLCIIILMLLAGKLRRADKSIEQFFLVTLMIGQSAMFFFDTLWVLTNAEPLIPPALNYAINILYFCSTAICPYLCLRYIRLTLTGNVFSTQTKYLLCLPAVFIFVFSLLSVRTGWGFTVTQGNVYHRGPLYVLIFLPPLCYMLATSVCALIYGRRSDRRDIRRRSVHLAVIMVLPIIGSLVDFLLEEVNVVCACITVSMVSVVFDFQQSKITKDTLTQLSNRYDLMLCLEERLEQLPRSSRSAEPMYVLFADVDRFKHINDTYGHLEGDHALCHVADALRKVCRSTGAFPARISGDEFVIVFSAPDDNAAEQFRQSVKNAVAEESKPLPYSLSISAGMTRCSAEDRADLSALLDRADAALYAEKKESAGEK